MSVNDRSAASRQFVASSAAYSSKWEKFTGQRAQIYAIVIFVVIVALGLLMIAGPTWGIHLRFPHIDPVVGYGALVGIVVVVVGMVAYLFWQSRRKYLITSRAMGSPSIGGGMMSIHSMMRTWAHGWEWEWRFICTVAATAFFWADEIAALVRRHRSTHHPCGPSTPGFRSLRLR